jgi:transcriptional antiterminator RfaH
MTSPHPMESAIEHTLGRTWTAAHTKPRCEKVVADYCNTRGIPCYLPLKRRAQRYQRRLVETFLPMFPGYLFVQLDSELRTVLLQSHRIVHILAVNEPAEQQLIDELNALREIEKLQDEQEIEVNPTIVPGALVRICEGPLKGSEGIVEKRNDGIRVTVNIELLGQSASVLIDSGDLEVED